MDFMFAYIFGVTNSTNFLCNAPARQRYFRLYRIESRHLPGADSAIQELEALCLSMCQAAEIFCRGFSDISVVTTPATSPVVYSKLSSQLDSSPCSKRRKDFVVASEVLDHLTASHETSGVTLTYLVHELSRSPILQSSLRAELLTLCPPLTCPLAPRNASVEEEAGTPLLPSAGAIDSLPLLNALIYETFRRYTVSPTPQHA